MNRKTKTALGGAAIVAATGYLMYMGIAETSLYYYEVDEFLERREALEGAGVKVAGRVQAGSVSWNPKTLELAFAMGDFPDPEAASPGPYPGAEAGDPSRRTAATSAPSGPGEGVVPVRFAGIKPDMFAEGRDVIVEGRYTEGVLVADKVLTSCPSKYEAEPGAAPAEAAGETAAAGARAAGVS